MRKTLTAIVTALMIFSATMPARAGYFDTATNVHYANENLAWGWYHASLQMHYASSYNYVDWGLIYTAWSYSVAARDQAWWAWWNAPSYSYAEYWALQAYYQLAALEQNLWIVYVYGGAYPSYATTALANATWGQIYLSYSAQAAAGRY
jgi:hypothetical protein